MAPAKTKPAVKATTTPTKRKTTTRSKAVATKPTASRAAKNTAQILLLGKLNALERVQATIEFETNGTIITANDNFLQATGYRLDEIQGKHHRIFVSSSYAASNEYRSFWDKLARGEFDAGEYERFHKSGNSLWLNASYNPIFDGQGNVIRVVKFATDITSTKQKNADYESQLKAINKSQAMIEFMLDGTVITANENFCSTLGYSENEIQGKHHRIFCDADYAATQEYRNFWDNLRHGEFQAGQFKRLGKGGREIWIQASYNPIFDLNGKPVKVVKYASDISQQKQLEFEVAAKQRSDAEFAAEQREKVAKVLRSVNALAEGDFATEVPDLGNDAVGQVAAALRDAIVSIRQTLLEVQEVSSTVASAAEQLNSSSREISSGAQTQASSLEETASSLEEITSTVKQNSDNAQQARQLANGSRDIAEKGGAVVSDAVAAMEEINQSSKKIADIITTIDEIAFQTNLLALNAAVEAARAGEQGRGFAVVAAEVRNLAQRSASAAKEIKALIQDSVHRVDNGTQLVNKSGETLSEIVGSVKRVTDIVAEIAAASKEQLTGIEQVNKAVAQMDRVTQANAAQTEEVSGTAASLLSQAETLQEQISRFQLGNANGASKAKQRRADNSSRSSQATNRRPARETESFQPERTFERAYEGVSEMLEF